MDSRNYEKTGRLIARKREEQGLTRNQLAEKIGVTSQAVGNWENGKRFPDADIQVKIFEILGLNPVELFAGLEMYDADAKANAASLMERMDEKVFAGGVVRDEDEKLMFRVQVMSNTYPECRGELSILETHRKTQPCSDQTRS